MEKIRSFISVSVPEMPRVRDSLKELRNIPGVSVPKEAHITLRFLGDTDVSKIRRLSSQMRSLEKYPPFGISVRGTGAFPNTRSPRTVWIGSELGDPFRSILSDIDAMLDSVGIDYDRKHFGAHITIGRVRDPFPRVTEFISEHIDLDAGSFVCSEILLMKSVLTAKGAEHTVIDSFRLSGE